MSQLHVLSLIHLCVKVKNRHGQSGRSLPGEITTLWSYRLNASGMPMATARSAHTGKNIQRHDIINIFIFYKTQERFRNTPQAQCQAADSSTNAADDLLFYSQQRSLRRTEPPSVPMTERQTPIINRRPAKLRR
jgi:hypothetical protein